MNPNGPIPFDEAMSIAKRLIIDTLAAKQMALSLAVKLCDDPKELIPLLREIKGLSDDLIKSLKTAKQ